MKHIIYHLYIPMTDSNELKKELTFRTSRSSGKGGQHVNKVSSKVELIFNVEASLLYSEDDKQQILQKSGNFLKEDGAIHIICQEGRSQYLNKKKAIEKLLLLIEKCLKPIKVRIETSIPTEEKEKRITEKKLKSEIKQSRRRIEE